MPFRFCILTPLFGLCLLFACQPPTLPTNLKPCQTTEDCGGFDCIQGLCGTATSEINEDKQPNEKTNEPSPEEATLEKISEPTPEPTPDFADENEPIPTEPTPEKADEPTSETITENASEPTPTEPNPEASDAAEPTPEVSPETECNNTDTRPCYTGTSGTAGVGTCKTGIETCGNGKWGPCLGQIVDVAEECNGKDDNCDGTIDNNLSRGCSSACGTGKETCTNGTWGGCNAQIPKAEDCNGLDDDCDGTIDNNLPIKLCTLSKGVCNGAKQTCNNGQWTDCTANDYKTHNANYETTETKCDGLDNDCNDKTDENNCACINGTTRACYNGSQGCIQNGGVYVCTSPCKAGTQICQNGQWSTCSGAVVNQLEVCNGIDDNCDGTIDNNLVPAPCTNQNGVCSGAKETCKAGAWSCDYAAHSPDYNVTEHKCDGKDNDCDGLVDEGIGCVCVPNTTQPCYTQGTGCTLSNGNYKCSAPCKAGTQTCLPDGKGWGDCSGEVTPQPETCNNIDDDCNGKIDDIPSSLCHTISTGFPVYCVQGLVSCTNGAESCKETVIRIPCQSNADCARCPQRTAFPQNATCQRIASVSQCVY